MAPAFGILDEGAAAADVVHVAVGVDDRMERVGAPAPHLLHHLAPALGIGGVEGHEPVASLEQDAVGEGLHHGHTVGDLRKGVVDPVDRPDVGGGPALVDHCARQRQKVGHGSLLPLVKPDATSQR